MTIKVFNVKDFGAKGDGETDDRAAVRRAAEAAAASNDGYCILFPPGHYDLRDQEDPEGAS